MESAIGREQNTNSSRGFLGALWPWSWIALLVALAAAAILFKEADQWEKGRVAEQVVGDTLSAAITSGKYCATAHGVSIEESLGDIDHLVVTPKCAWIVVAQDGWIPEKRFRKNLAANCRQHGRDTPPFPRGNGGQGMPGID